jgi:hypothetical protein
LKLLLVEYVSAVVQLLLSQLNCICPIQLGSYAYRVSVVVGLFVADAHQLIDIVVELGGVVSGGIIDNFAKNRSSKPLLVNVVDQNFAMLLKDHTT